MDLERLWSPWRMEYMGSAGREDVDCIFCAALAADNDEELFVVHRDEHAFVILNAFPYNTGHVMVAPNRHTGDLSELSVDERSHLMELTAKSLTVIRDAMQPEGFNTGMNIGKAAGAGIPGHLHVQVVPRWSGDTNFMPIVANTKVLPEMLAETYAKLKPGFS
jgi:ATP adenylyltransferase